jgi:adenylosuccinate lyase
VPEACLLAGAALDLAKRMLARLEVHPEAMRRNLGTMAASEKLLAALAPSEGKHAAQDLLQRALAAGGSLQEVASAAGLNGADLLAPDAGAAGEMVDEVVRRARAARASEPEVWP